MNKTKNNVRPWVKWAWSSFWLLWVFFFGFFGYLVYSKNLPQIKIPFTTFFPDKSTQQKPLPSINPSFNEGEVIAKYEQLDMTQFDYTNELRSILENQEFTFVSQKVYSIKKSIDKNGAETEFVRIYQFFNGNYYLSLDVEFKNNSYEFVYGEVGSFVGEAPSTISNDSFLGENAFVYSQFSHTPNMKLKELTITPSERIYTYWLEDGKENKEMTFSYDRQTQKVTQKQEQFALAFFMFFC